VISSILPRLLILAQLSTVLCSLGLGHQVPRMLKEISLDLAMLYAVVYLHASRGVCPEDSIQLQLALDIEYQLVIELEVLWIPTYESNREG
jgi:hypothetical protein